MNITLIKEIIQSFNSYLFSLYVTEFDKEFFDDGYVSSIYVEDNNLYIKGKSKLSSDDEEECFEIMDISKGVVIEIKNNTIKINNITMTIDESL